MAKFEVAILRTLTSQNDGLPSSFHVDRYVFDDFEEAYFAFQEASAGAKEEAEHHDRYYVIRKDLLANQPAAVIEEVRHDFGSKREMSTHGTHYSINVYIQLKRGGTE